MAKSAAGRKRERRAQLKSNEENYSKYLVIDRNRKKKARDTQKEQMSPTKWNKHLAKDRKRIQNYRKKLKETLLAPKSTPPLLSPYQTPRTIGKAIKKAAQSLPSSPRKKQYIVKHLAKEVGVDVASSKKKAKNGLNDSTIAKMKDF